MVLVVDAATTCDLVADLPEMEGYVDDCATDGQSGLSRILQGGVDLVLLDLRLPGVAVLDILSAVRRRERGQRVPIVEFTALAGDIEAYALAAGADDFLAKPFNADDLIGRVRKHRRG